MAKRGTKDWSDLLNRPDVLVVGTATSGFGPEAEVLEIAILDTLGEVRYEAPVLPEGPIQPDAGTLHDLTLETLREMGARSWPEHHEAVAALLRDADTVLAYNASHNSESIAQTAERYGLHLPGAQWRCLMLDYAVYRAAPDPKQERERQSDKTADYFENGEERRALGDATLALSLMQVVAEWQRFIASRDGLVQDLVEIRHELERRSDETGGGGLGGLLASFVRSFVWGCVIAGALLLLVLNANC